MTSEASLQGLHIADLRAANRSCVLRLLRGGGMLSRAALAKQSGLSRTTVGSIVKQLLDEGAICEAGTLPASRAGGRRAVLLREVS